MGRAPIKLLPSQQELRELFDYSPETGALIWKKVRAKAYRISVGGPAGTVTTRGYLQVGIQRRYYLVHRIIWKLVTGEEPTFQIDHKDTDRLNNRWLNLRNAQHGENRANAKIGRNNRSSVKGVCYESKRGTWKAYISAGKGQIRLGRFRTLEEAARVRREAAEKLHGEFMRVA